MPTQYRYNVDGSAVCPHRDLTCCPTCVAADPNLRDVAGAHYLFTDAEFAALLEEVAR